MRAVLTYHSIDSSGSPISTAPAAFRRQLEWLERERVAVMPLDEVVSAPEGTRAAALTFDDGFANFETEAAPLLLERRWPVTLFVVSDRVGRDNAWGDREVGGIPTLPLLDWPTLGRLAERGVALGCHTRTHPRLSTVHDAALADEIGASGERIERETGRRPDWFAYPYGDVDDRVADAVGRRYRLAVTTEHRPLGEAENPRRVPRMDMYYLRDAERLPAWDGLRLRAQVWLRRQARRARALVSGR
jgi:peptidoglycan/xylan/chitin deacetylase (PgdA/CDA1 family)